MPAERPDLRAAYRDAQPLAPIYVHDENAAGEWALGGASRRWRCGSALKNSRQQCN